MRHFKMLAMIAVLSMQSGSVFAGAINGVSGQRSWMGLFQSCDERVDLSNNNFSCTDSLKEKVRNECYVFVSDTVLPNCTWQACDRVGVVGKKPAITRVLSTAGGVASSVEIDEYGIKSPLNNAANQCDTTHCLPKSPNHVRTYMTVKDALKRRSEGLKGDNLDPLVNIPSSILNSNPYLACANQGFSKTARVVRDGERHARHAFEQIIPNNSAESSESICRNIFNNYRNILRSGTYRCYVDGQETASHVSTLTSSSWKLTTSVDTFTKMFWAYLTLDYVNGVLPATGSHPTLGSYVTIREHLKKGIDALLLDVDRDGAIRTNDAVLIARFSFGTFPGNALIKDAISEDSSLIPSGKNIGNLTEAEKTQITNSVVANVRELF